MQSYIGVRCPVCNKKFHEADDIVVCPVCGAPHHRDCYAVKNQCAFASDHLAGKEWRAPAPQPPAAPENAAGTRDCPRCGSANPAESIFCQVCGQSLALPCGDQQDQPGQSSWSSFVTMNLNTISMAYGGLEPDDQIDGETARDIACYVGSGSAYYLPRFQVFSVGGRTFMPNLSAFIFGFFYYFYRRMYLLGGLLLALFIVSNIPTFLYTWEVIIPTVLQNLGFVASVNINQAVADHYMQLSNIARSINTVIALIFSMYSNRVYYGRVLTAVHEIRESAEKKSPPEDYKGVLERAGGSSVAAVAIAASALIVVYFGILSVMMNLYLGA